MAEFNAATFVQNLEELGITLRSVKMSDGTYRVCRWLSLYAVEHKQEVNELWQSQLRSDIIGIQSRIDMLASYLANAPQPVSAKLSFDRLVN